MPRPKKVKNAAAVLTALLLTLILSMSTLVITQVGMELIVAEMVNEPDWTDPAWLVLLDAYNLLYAYLFIGS